MTATAQNNKLITGKVGKLFFSYLLPGIGATLATSIYILVDTIMIGQFEGNDGIVALNIVLPIFSIVCGLGALFGVGGGVMYSIAKATGDDKTARGYFTAALIMLSAVTLVVWVLIIVFFQPIMRMFGASDNSMPLVKKYGEVIAWGSPLFAFTIFLQAVLRNDRAPKLAMVATISGGLLNVLLDYLLIYPCKMGIAGAAYATLVSYAVNTLICCFHFLRKRNGLRLAKPYKGSFVDVPMSGLSSFFIELAGGFTIFLFNRQIISCIGEYGVVVYGVISNLTIVGMSIFNGVAQAAQPLLSTNYGAGQRARVLKILKIATVVTGCISVLMYLMVVIYPNMWVYAFSKNPSQEVLSLATFALRVALTSFLMASFNILFAAYFQSCLKPKISFLLTILRGFILIAVFAFLLPLISPSGIWFAAPLAEVVVAIITVGILIFQHKKSIKEKSTVGL